MPCPLPAARRRPFSISTLVAALIVACALSSVRQRLVAGDTFTPVAAGCGTRGLDVATAAVHAGLTFTPDQGRLLQESSLPTHPLMGTQGVQGMHLEAASSRSDQTCLSKKAPAERDCGFHMLK